MRNLVESHHTVPTDRREKGGRVDPTSDWLDVGDAIAAEILAELAPLRFREAENQEERDACFRLRYRAVLEVGMTVAEHFHDGLERDEFDDTAIQITAWDGERAVATCRLIAPLAGRPLPVEEAFELRVSPDRPVLEWGRVVVDPLYRGDGHSMLMGLIACGWLSMRARGYSAAIGATPKRLVGLLEALGFTVELLGAPRRYWGEERYPILCGGHPAVAGLEREWLPGDRPQPTPPG
jgi:GNAT superfamily N-acetyltransferase